MKLQYAVLADYITWEYTGKLIIIGVFERISASTPLPVVCPPFYMAARFAASLGEGTDQHMVVEVVDPDGQPVFKTEPLKLTFVPTGPGRHLVAQMRLRFPNLELPGHEDYEFKIYVGESFLGSVELQIVPADQAPGHEQE